jgi:hypothetical protein
MKAFGKYIILLCMLLGAITPMVAQTEPAVSFEVVDAATDDPLSTIPVVRAGEDLSIKLRVLDQDGVVVSTYAKDVQLTLRGEHNQETTVVVLGADILAGGGEASSTITTTHAMTARFEVDGNGWLYEVGARISATDGTVMTDNASGFFSINPARFAVTYSGSDNPLSSNRLTSGRSYLARVTAYNADNTVASGYRGRVEIGLTHTETAVDEFIINGARVVVSGAGYDSDNPPEVTITGGGGDGATARATTVEGDEITMVGAVGLESAGSGYTSLPTITI